MESRIQVPLTNAGIEYLESGIRGVDSRIQDCLGFPYSGVINLIKKKRRTIAIKEHKIWKPNKKSNICERNWAECSGKAKTIMRKCIFACVKVARLDFWGWYLPTLSINYVGMSKDMEKRLPQLYYIKMKISYDLGFIAIGVVMAKKWRHYVFHLSLGFSVPGGFWRNRFREYVPAIIASIMAEFEQILWERFRNILKCSFKNNKNSEIAC